MNYIDNIIKSNDFLKSTLNWKGIVKKDLRTINNISFQVLDLGIIKLTPSNYNETLIISTSIHGNETKPLKAINCIVGDILQGKVSLKKEILVIISNIEAIREGKRFSHTNMNSIFTKESFESPEFNRIRIIKNALKEFISSIKNNVRAIDLHSSIKYAKYNKFAILPKNCPDVYDDIFSHLKIDASVYLKEESPSFTSYIFKEYKIPCSTIELDIIESLNDPIDFNLVESLKNIIEEVNYEKINLIRYKIYKTIIKETESHRINLKEDFKNFDQYPKGYRIVSDENDVILKENLSLLFPNEKVLIGNRSLFLLKKI